MNTTSRSTSKNDDIIVDLNALPQVVDRSPGKSGGVFFLFFALFWLGLSLTIMITIILDKGLDLKLGLFISVFLSIGFALLAFALHLLTSKKVMTFSKTHVDIFSKNLLKAGQSQTVSYHAFKGILLDHHVVRRDKQPDITYQTITLVHDNKDLNCTLYEVEGTTPPRDLWKSYVKTLRLPALQKDGDTVQELHHDEMDMSLRERGQRGYSTNFDRSQLTDQVPQELNLDKNNNQLEINILVNRLTMPVKMMFLLVPLLFVLMPLIDSKVPIIFPLIGLGFALIVITMIILDMHNPRKIVISRSKISIKDAQPQGSHKKTVSTLPLDQIESILIKAQPFNEHIAIIGKNGEMSTGAGMSRDTLEWLQNYLRAAVITA